MTIDDGLLAQGLIFAFIGAALIATSTSLSAPLKDRVIRLAIVLIIVAILSVLGAVWTAVALR